MTDEIRTEDKTIEENKALMDEIADIDFTGDDRPLDTPTEEDPKTVDDEEKKNEETVEGDKKPVDESKEVSDDEKKKEEDTKVSEEKKGEKVSTEDKGEKSEKPKEEEPVKEEISQVDKLLAEIERLSGLTESGVEIPKEEKEGKPEEKKGKVEEKKEDSIHDFIKDIDMDDVSSDPKVLNEILHNVIARVQQQTTEQVLRSIPQVVMSQVQQQTYFKRMADKFYDDNKDLANVKQVVRACAQQIQKDNPEWEIEKVFTETAKKTRETLGMSAHVVNTDKTDETVPSAEEAAFAKSKGGSKSNLKQQKSSLQAEIDEL